MDSAIYAEIQSRKRSKHCEEPRTRNRKRQGKKDIIEIQKEERNEADIEETDTQRKKQANKALWKKRIPTTITIGTEYRKTNKIERRK